MEAYCVRCRAKVEIDNPQQVTLKNGKPATKGICSNGCGMNVYNLRRDTDTSSDNLGVKEPKESIKNDNSKERNRIEPTAAKNRPPGIFIGNQISWYRSQQPTRMDFRGSLHCSCSFWNRVIRYQL